MRVNVHTLRSCEILIGRALWYASGRPTHLRIRRDRGGGHPQVVALVPCMLGHGYTVGVKPGTQPRIRLGRQQFLDLGLNPGMFAATVTSHGVIEFSLW